MVEALSSIVISSLLTDLTTTAWKWVRGLHALDFVAESPDGLRLGIEIVNGSPTDRDVSRLSDLLRRHQNNLDKLLVVSIEEPDNQARQSVESDLYTPGVQVSWIGINGLPSILGVERRGDLRSPETISSIQVAAVTANIARYSIKHIGPELGPIFQTRGPGPSPSRQAPLGPEYQYMSRQFSYETIARLSDSEPELPDLLGIGSKIDHVTVVLSDIKNFSSLVKASRSEDLNDIMGKYYSSARDLVWKHGGTLDKFIGDATLAIFGYPFSQEDAPIKALEFSRDLIDLGIDLLSELKRLMNETIKTGTRVGISTGDIWALDLGRGAIEVSFVGDVINLAARLEQECQNNGVLIDNISRTKALESNRAYLGNLDLSYVELSIDQAKGQLYPVRAWQMPPIAQSI